MSIPQKSCYVVLKHTTPDGIHWDFMLETRDNLKTWRITTPPQKLQSTVTNAEKIFDHPKKFLTYEGSVNNGTGNVVTVDKGTYSIVNENENELNIQIVATILNGIYTLTKITEKNWKISAN